MRTVPAPFRRSLSEIRQAAPVRSAVPSPLRRRASEIAFVFPRELGGTFVADLVGDGGEGEVQAVGFDKALGFGQPQLFLVLQGADAGEVAEVAVEAGKAHAAQVGELLHIDGVGEMAFQVVDGPADLQEVAAEADDLPDSRALLAG